MYGKPTSQANEKLDVTRFSILILPSERKRFSTNSLRRFICFARGGAWPIAARSGPDRRRIGMLIFLRPLNVRKRRSIPGSDSSWLGLDIGARRRKTTRCRRSKNPKSKSMKYALDRTDTNIGQVNAFFVPGTHSAIRRRPYFLAAFL